MARHEADREDLFAEAVAITRRVEWLPVADNSTDSPLPPIVAGWRENGSFSVYWGQDWTWQVDDQHQIRRGYVLGKLYRSQGRALAELERLRTDQETVLQRRDLTPEEFDRLRDSIRGGLRQLVADITSEKYTVSRQEPATLDVGVVVAELQQLSGAPLPLAPALAPARG